MVRSMVKWGVVVPSGISREEGWEQVARPSLSERNDIEDDAPSN